jgi:hypothetical protein
LQQPTLCSGVAHISRGRASGCRICAEVDFLRPSAHSALAQGRVKLRILRHALPIKPPSNILPVKSSRTIILVIFTHPLQK